MANILVSGLINTETTVRVRQFPVSYYPIDYPFFGVNTAVSGVAYNISKALKTLGDDVTLLTMTGRDFPAEYIQSQLCTAGIGTDWVKPRLKETPNSVVLYDGEGKRQIYCDLKDIQETPYDFPEDICRDADVVAACNINFNRPLLHQAKTLGKTVATDVHVLSDIHDEFNREFMSCADILFLSDEGIRGDYRDFLRALGDTYGNRIIVLGRGAEGAACTSGGKPHFRPARRAGGGNRQHRGRGGRPVQRLPALFRARIPPAGRTGTGTDFRVRQDTCQRRGQRLPGGRGNGSALPGIRGENGILRSIKIEAAHESAASVFFTPERVPDPFAEWSSHGRQPESRGCSSPPGGI